MGAAGCAFFGGPELKLFVGSGGWGLLGGLEEDNELAEGVEACLFMCGIDCLCICCGVGRGLPAFGLTCTDCR